jgi:8-amino-7-oxononanoate synthase
MTMTQNDVFTKCNDFTRAQKLRDLGLYPYFQAIESSADREVTIGGRRMIMIGSNNYLGLTTHPKVVEAAAAALQKYGTGCTGSRFLNGTLDIHEELERRLAKFMRKETALLFSTGFQANLGGLSVIPGKNDLILCDRMNHASVIDGTRLSFASTVKFQHNDMHELGRLLTENKRFCVKKLLSQKDNGVLVVTEGVFSMEGDLGDLPGIVKLKKEHGFRIFLDDAHGIGCMGPGGRGVAEHFGVENEIDLVMGTFSKSFASLGGFLAGPESVIDYIKHTARALMFSASMPPSAVATVLAALEIMEHEPEHRERLHRNVRKMCDGYRRMGFNVGNTQSPVVPILVGDAEKTLLFWKALFEEGVFVNPIIAPAVPADMCLLRTSYMATHTDEELDRVLEIMERVGKKLGVVGSGVQV